jgi:hypothetical protein
VLPIKFQLIWPNGFREVWQSQTRTAYGSHGNIVQDKCFHRRRFLEIDQPETKMDYGVHVYSQIKTK